MKNILSCVIFIMCFSQLQAQTTSTVSANIRYRIDPEDSTVSPPVLFISRLSGFSTSDKNALLELTASHILQKTKSGDSVTIYNPSYELLPGFSPSLRIIDCAVIPATDFSMPASQIGQPWIVSGKHSYFKLRKGKVGAENLIVQADKKISYATDTLLVENGDKFIPLLSYRYLEPENVSLFFSEHWSFDFTNGKMDKNISYYGYFVRKISYTGDFIGYTPALCIQNSLPANSILKMVLLKKNVVCDVAISWPEQMLKNDSNVQRYSGADAVNYLAIPFGTIPAGERVKFLAGLFNFALLNPKNVFPFVAGKIDSLHSFTTTNQVKEIFRKNESNRYYDSETGDYVTVNYVAERTLDEVYAIRFYEDWYYDAATLTIKKNVRGIGFIMITTNENGEPRLYNPGIYIGMN